MAGRPVLVGFAAETDDVVRKAREKRARKSVDLIVANDVSQPDRGFDADTNAVTLVGDEGDEDVPLQSKDARRRDPRSRRTPAARRAASARAPR